MKNRWIAFALCLLLVTSIAVAVYAQARAVKPKTVTVVGEVVDLACYMHEGAKGPKHKQCAIACAKNGVPLGVLEDRTGKLYLGLGRDAMEAAKFKDLRGFEAAHVRVTGMVFERGGLRGLAITSIKKV